MIEINKVVLSVLACLENDDVKNEILKDYELKLQKLEHYNDYLQCEEFKTKKINDVNFRNCVNFAISKISDTKFRLFVEKSNICYIVFYKKENTEENLLSNKLNKHASSISSLSSITVKHFIEDSNLIICVNPVKVYKERILANKDELLEYFNSKGKNVDNVIVKFIHNDVILDDLSETFLDLGYTIK